MMKKGERTVQISVSVPLSIASAIDEEGLVMGKSYSETTCTLIRIGLDVRRAARGQEGEKT